MSFQMIESGLFHGTTASEVGKQISDWLANQEMNTGLKRIYDQNTNGVQRSLFTYKNEPIGIDLVTKDTVFPPEIQLKPSYSVYAISSGSKTVIGAKSVNTCSYTNSSNTTVYVEGEYSFPCQPTKDSRYSDLESNWMEAGAWYLHTEKGGLLVGLYSGTRNRIYMNCPVYIGTVRNEFLNEDYVYVVNLNRGIYPVGGFKTDSAGTQTALPTGHSIGSYANAAGQAAVMGESTIQPDITSHTFYPMYLQHIHPYTAKDGSNYAVMHNTISYSPLFAAFANHVFCPVFQVDDFYTGAFSVQTHQPMMEKIAVNGQVFVPITSDGVALRLNGETMANIHCAFKPEEV